MADNVTFLGIATFSIALILGANSEAQEKETAVFAGGCFWCVEKDFDSVEGVLSTISGFTGGQKPAGYKEVTSGKTGHYEAVKIEYDPNIVSYEELTHKFWRSVDPTDAGGQFCDRGKSYRTAIFALNEEQRQIAETSLGVAEQDLGQRIVTPILDAGEFYPADDYHQNYYQSNAIVLTRFGPLTKAKAYERYRSACGRDQRVFELWGDEATFATKNL